MKIKLKLLSILTCVLLALSMMPFTVLAADSNGDGYDDGDVAIIQNIVRQSETLMDNYGLDDPAKYDFITWSNQRVISINLESCYNAAGEGFIVKDLSGSLDVSGLDALITLICHDNPNLTALRFPSSTTYINCDNTGITELDVSGCYDLEILYCAQTKITSLDISKNTKLKELLCYGTDIEALNISQNTALERLMCYETAIKSLDVSNNTALTELQCDDTALTELDVSKNTALESLSCYNTGIKSLDVSNNTALTSLVGLETVSQLTVAGGHTLNIVQPANSTIFIENVDAPNNTVTLRYYSESVYQLVGWNGVPADATKTDTAVTFKVTKDLTVSADEEKINFEGPSVSADEEKTDPDLLKSPQTGDNGSILVWITLLLASGCCLFGTALYDKKRKKSNKN